MTNSTLNIVPFATNLNAWQRACEEPNWLVFAVTEADPDTGKKGKFPVAYDYRHAPVAAPAAAVHTFEVVCRFVKEWGVGSAEYEGRKIIAYAVGYLPRPESALVIGDLDNCRDPISGALCDWASDLMGLCDTYVEVSTSGTGLRLLMEREPDDDQYSSGERHDVGFFANGGRAAVITFQPAIDPQAPVTPATALKAAILARKGVTGSNAGQTSTITDPVALDLLRGVVGCIPNDDPKGRGYDEWVKIGYAIKLSDPGPDGKQIFLDWSAKFSGKVDPKLNPAKIWDGLKPDGDATFGSLVDMARKAQGGSMPPDVEAMMVGRNMERHLALIPAVSLLPPGAHPVGTVLPGVPMVSPDTSQDELAVELGRIGWNDAARFVATSGKFMFWNQTIWEIDGTLKSFTLIREFLRWKSDELNSYLKERLPQLETEGEKENLFNRIRRLQKEIKSNATVAAVNTMMQSNPGTVVTIGDLNLDKMKLGTPMGTVDLRTGVLMESDRLDLITKSVAITPAEPGTPAPIWQAFLKTVMAGDQEMIDFLQRCAGYALTGRIDEHKFGFLYGTGRNGKGVFLNTMIGIMGAYGRKAPASVFLETANSDHPTQLAGLQGMRMVFGSEIGEGQFWNETLLKDATGGDMLTARFMRQDFFDFFPEFFLMIAGNNKPALRGTDQAIRDRIMLIPFTVYIPKEQRDQDLPDKLRNEWPAILRWMIDGCLQWQRIGLNPPASVLAASDTYVDGEDFLGQFIEDTGEIGVDHAVSVSEFVMRYNGWRAGEGLQPLPKIKVRKEMEKRGYAQDRVRPNKIAKENPVMSFIGLKMSDTAPYIPPPS